MWSVEQSCEQFYLSDLFNIILTNIYIYSIYVYVDVCKTAVKESRSFSSGYGSPKRYIFFCKISQIFAKMEGVYLHNVTHYHLQWRQGVKRQNISVER